MPVSLHNHHFWLGGDLYSNDFGLTRKFNCLNYYFNLSSPHTHWAIGNHDFDSTFFDIEAQTLKPSYYATYINGITLIVMNSNLYDVGSDCEAKNEQTDYINSVLDTIDQSSHVILMSHHVFWGRINDDTTDVFAYANTNLSNRYFYCQPDQKLETAIYPAILKLREKGKTVVFLSGDLGQKSTAYQHINKDGVVFLGNGILTNTLYNQKFSTYAQNDSVLVFTHYPAQRKLAWKFVNVGH